MQCFHYFFFLAYFCLNPDLLEIVQKAEAKFCEPFMRINGGKIAEPDNKFNKFGSYSTEQIRINNFASGSNDPVPIIGFLDLMNEDPDR